MAAVSAHSTHVVKAETGDADRISFIAEVRQFWQQFFVAAFTAYRPELHYMRGPGPAWRAKHQPPAKHA